MKIEMSLRCSCCLERVDDPSVRVIEAAPGILLISFDQGLNSPPLLLHIRYEDAHATDQGADSRRRKHGGAQLTTASSDLTITFPASA
jgi:hypothetical protein